MLHWFNSEVNNFIHLKIIEAVDNDLVSEIDFNF